MENLDFSEEEIEQQLAALGYTNIPEERLREFKRDLDLLISHEKSKSQTSAEWISPKSQSSSCKSPPVITKEKVEVHRTGSSYSYIYSHNGAADQQRPVMNSTFHEGCHDVSVDQASYDSYIKHSVAPKYIRPSTAPNRLQLEEAPSEIYHSLLGSNQTGQELHTNARPAIKRKVLRKNQGQSQVCDESTYSEDSACNSYWDNARDEDKESLSSSFWTDQESEEEEREYFVKDDSRDGRDEKEPGINIHENKETHVKEVNMNDWTVGKLRENENCSKADKQCSIKQYTRDESTENHLCEKLRNDTTEISSDKESDEDKEERECFVKDDSTDESSKSISGSGESTEEESEDYVKESSDNKTESSESDQECFTGEKEEREADYKEMIYRQKVMSDKQQSISCAEDEYVGSEYLSSVEEENKEECDKHEHEEDEGTEKMSGSNDCSVNEESEGEHGYHFVNNDHIDRRVDEETTNVDLESEEEIEYFVSDAKHNFTTCEDEGSRVFFNQEGVDRLVLKEDCIGEEPEIKSSRQRIDRQEEEGHFLNTNYHYIVLNKSLEEKECEEKPDKNKITTFMAENPTSVVQNKTCSNRYYTAETERTGQMNNKQDKTKEGYTVPELKRENSFDQEKRAKRNEEIHGETVAFNDNCGSVCSPTLSILTSGYGTYRPDSPKDDLDVADFRDDATLTGLEEDTEFSSAIYGEEDNIQSVFQHTVHLEASEEQIHSLSLRGSDACESVAVLHNIDNKQDTTDENRYGSPNVRKENDQILHLASTFGGFPAKPTISGITSQGLSEGNHSSHSWEPDMVLEDYRHPFNLRLSKNMTVVGHRNEYGLSGQETRNTKKAKSQNSKRVEPVSELEERLDQLRVSAPNRQHELYSETDETGSYSDRHSSATEQLPSAFQAYVKGMTRSHSESDIRPRPKSFIRPVMDHPHTRNLKKTDPVAKYYQYKQNWEMFKPPGEKSRKELHWAIREQLMYQPPPPKPQRTYVPNTYVVPTEKKRSALRWEIRHDLANGIIPTKITYP